MINKTSYSAIPIKQTNNNEEQPKQSFGKAKIAEKSDSFESQTLKKQKTKLEIALIAISGASITGYAIVRGKLGKALDLLGEIKPKTIIGRTKKLSDIASHDALLTNILSRKALDVNIIKDYKNALKDGKRFIVAMYDMDNFKKVNDVFSHDKGDKVLERIASIINEISKKYGGKAYRYGGEEFVTTISTKDPTTAHKMSKEISEAISDDPVIKELLEKFEEISTTDLDYVNRKLPEIDSIFSRLRQEKGTDYNDLKYDIISLIKNHTAKYNPSDTKNLDQLIKTLETTEPEKLPTVLNVNTKIGEESTLGKELNKIHENYSGHKSNLEKWTSQFISTDKKHTISAGLVDSKDVSSLIKEGNKLTEIADEALKSAKENGRNQIVIADENIINKTMEKLKEKENKS